MDPLGKASLVLCWTAWLGQSHRSDHPPDCRALKVQMNQMNHKIGARYHVLLQPQYTIWTIYPFEGHLVLKGSLMANFWRTLLQGVAQQTWLEVETPMLFFCCSDLLSG